MGLKVQSAHTLLASKKDRLQPLYSIYSTTTYYLLASVLLKVFG